ncbi:ShlB/FhaC/HecB family hemolysin secretion/activation protein [Plastoroseomonas arctica]|uniref:ShlB/FhaC/HecB family hemolysin secretion/activation protein n=1 Tax=Plastoroseomonas arctica TaxID=1509237 RepID=A0AAF1JX63_9PROT|nr:ShlB/FhaC/HecB family hemolysin secretion/activation protein [Plastoroseomonas arctica]
MTIARVAILGNTVLSADALRPLVTPLEGQNVTLARVEQARLAIVTAYRNAGYAFVTVAAALAPSGPDQSDLQLSVTEGYVAEVRLEGDIGPAGTQVLRFLNGATEQRPVRVETLERALLLASDVPGVTVRGLLQPVQGEPGALRLVAQVSRRPITGYATVDNRAYRLTGPFQALAVLNANSFTEFGERTEVSTFLAERESQYFGQAAFETFLGGSGLRMRLYAGTGVTRPVGELESVGFTATTQVGGFSLSYPIIRSRPLNLTAVGQFDIYNAVIENEINGNSTRVARDEIRAYRGGVDLQFSDTAFGLLPLSINLGTVRVSQGTNRFGASRNDALDVSRQSSVFNFLKVAGEFQRTQPLFAPFNDTMINIQGLVSGQFTNDILPSAERFFLGGNRLLRGYYVGQAAGDRGYGYALELQLDTAWDVPLTPFPGSGRATSQFYVFQDYGRVTQNLASDRDVKAVSYGGGVRTVISETVGIDLEFTRRLTRRIDGENSEPLRSDYVYIRTSVRF